MPGALIGFRLPAAVAGEIEDLVFLCRLLEQLHSTFCLVIIKIDKRIVQNQKRLLVRIHCVRECKPHTHTDQILIACGKPLRLAKLSLLLLAEGDIGIDLPVIFLGDSDKQVVIFAERI